jgi:anthranilate phosphoribosyltransferase
LEEGAWEIAALEALQEWIIEHEAQNEVSTIGPTMVAEMTHGRIDHYTITPDVFGVPRARREDIETHSGEESGPKRDIVAVNSGTALFLLGRAKTLREGTELAIAQLANRASATCSSSTWRSLAALASSWSGSKDSTYERRAPQARLVLGG